MSIIEQIRSKVERMKTESISEESVSQDDNYYEGRISVCDEILNFLDTLQEQPVKDYNKLYKDIAKSEWFKKSYVGKSLGDEVPDEQPLADGLEEEIERYLHSLGVGYGGWVDGMEDDDLRGIARHFAQWGAEHRGSSEIPKDLEEAAEKSYPNKEGDLCSLHSTLQRAAFIAGAKWQAEQDTRDMFMSDNRHFEKVYELGKKDMKEQMMKGAIDAEFCSAGMFMPMIDFKDKRMEGIKYGDTIKVIVIKEK